LNKHFKHNEITFGIGIDHGNMLATKTGIRRHGSAQQSYRALVWLGRPANVASKLTDKANKPEEAAELVKVNVAYNYFGIGPLTYAEEWPHEFVQQFTYDSTRGLMIHSNPAFHSFTTVTRRYVSRPKTPAVLMTKAVYDGFRAARPAAPEIKNEWLQKIDVQIPDYSGEVYGGDVVFTAFTAT
jgi:adenylate cyclase